MLRSLRAKWRELLKLWRWYSCEHMLADAPTQAWVRDELQEKLVTFVECRHCRMRCYSVATFSCRMLRAVDGGLLAHFKETIRHQQLTAVMDAFYRPNMHWPSWSTR